MANSITATINTSGDWEKISDITSFTFSDGNKYVMQIQNIGYLKISDAEFCIKDEKFQYTATSDDLYIKTNGDIILTILEG